jgi:hypothetical protein
MQTKKGTPPTMMTFLIRAESVFKQLDQFLAQFSAMVSQQRAINSPQTPDHANADLLKQMLHAKAVVEDRRRDLHASLNDLSADNFVHELWSLAGDMPHFDFDLSHLTGSDALSRLREDISLDALTLTKDLSQADNMTAFVAELTSQRGGVSV